MFFSKLIKYNLSFKRQWEVPTKELQPPTSDDNQHYMTAWVETWWQNWTGWTLSTKPNKKEVNQLWKENRLIIIIRNRSTWQLETSETKPMSLDHLAGAEQDLKQDCEKVHMCMVVVVTTQSTISINWPPKPQDKSIHSKRKVSTVKATSFKYSYFIYVTF